MTKGRSFGLLFSPVLLILLSILPRTALSQARKQTHLKGGLGDRIAKAVVFDGRLWLRGTLGKNQAGDYSGALVSIRLSDLSKQVPFQEGVLDIQKNGPELRILRRSSAKDFSVSRWNGSAFEELGNFVSTDEDQPFALLNDGDVPVVIWEKSLRIRKNDGTWHSVTLHGKLRQGVQTAVASPLAGGAAYVGINSGEWGGGLQSVDLRTGTVTNIERRDSKDPCAGPLNSDCDPVTGVLSDPQNKDCVLASVGLVHFSSRGRILRVCGEAVSVVYENAEKEEINHRKFETSEAFFGLASAQSGFWAIAPGVLYHFGVDGKKADQHRLPKLKSESGIRMSRELPGVVVLRTDVNWSVSLSGYTPLVVGIE